MKSIFFGLVYILVLMALVSCEKAKEPVAEDIVINELMPVNTTTIADQNGEFDDWIELFNLSDNDKDISGYYLSDNKSKVFKWHFPEGTTIPANGFLIIWADDDTTQVGLHTNYKLSSLGEEVVLANRSGIIIDEIDFPEHTSELSYSRVPNGTGIFIWQNPTFGISNNQSK
jgi:hypothetical protein